MVPTTQIFIEELDEVLQRQLRITHSPCDAREALKTAIPAILSGVIINTAEGEISLHGEDARAVFNLVTVIALTRSGQGGLEGIAARANGVDLTDEETAFLWGFDQKTSELSAYGARLLLDPSELRMAKGLSRKGLVFVTRGCAPDSMVMMLTPLGAAVWLRKRGSLSMEAVVS